MKEFALTPKDLGEEIKKNLDNLFSAREFIKKLKNDEEAKKSIISVIDTAIADYDLSISRCAEMGVHIK